MKRVSWINLILGIWLVMSPYVLGLTGVTATVANNIVLGIVLIATSWWILATTIDMPGVGLFQTLCGIWLVIAPFVLKYSAMTHALANDIVVGVIVFIVGLVESQALAHRRIKTA